MKKLLLLLGVVSAGVSSYAQRVHTAHGIRHTGILNENTFQHFNSAGFAQKTTGIGSIDTLSNIAAADTPLVLYYLGLTSDSGFVTGTDAYGDQSYAERYDFNGADSSMQVIGVVALFGGTVNPASTKTVNFQIWDVSDSGVNDYGNYYYSGLPNNVLASQSVPFTQLGIGITSDTEKYYAFTNPPSAPLTSSYSQGSFYVGYQMSYDPNNLGGDTIGLFTSQDGDRTSPIYTVSGSDTIINVQNATQINTDTWYDNVFDNFGIENDLAIFPVVLINFPASVNSVTRNNLTFFGNYPDPAINNTNITFSLAKTADVTVQVMDMNGRLMDKIQQADLGAGQHIITVSTGNLAAGNYLYVVSTSYGDGIASKFTVVK